MPCEKDTLGLRVLNMGSFVFLRVSPDAPLMVKHIYHCANHENQSGQEEPDD